MRNDLEMLYIEFKIIIKEAKRISFVLFHGQLNVISFIHIPCQKYVTIH